MERTPSLRGPAPRTSSTDARQGWWLDANIIEAPVYAMRDTTGTGRGDLPGLMQRLPFLRWMGHDTVWIPPFYPSGGCDRGYDVTDERGVDEQYGSVDDFHALVACAHRLGMKVIIDVVACHLSSDHRFFRASRRKPKGKYGQWFVWSAEGDKYVSHPHGVPRDRKTVIANLLWVPETARTVLDADGDEVPASNWTYDPVRREHYYHKFLPGQPALNYDHPPVRRWFVDLLRYWARLGVDGFRIDAAPYMYVEEGTSCEGLPQGHAFIAEVQAELAGEFPGLMLLCESDVPDIPTYFGDGRREFDVAYDFPGRRAAHAAIDMRDARVMTDAVGREAPAPPGCAYIRFPSCHDDMREREIAGLRARFGDGIKGLPFVDDAVVGSLASYMRHRRRAMELLVMQLMSLPGAWMSYYLDLVGGAPLLELAGELQDLRDVTRWPMPWSDEHNAGFSTAPASKLYLPLSEHPVGGHRQVNVAAQLGDPRSWLHWLRMATTVRGATPALSIGDMRVLETGDPKRTWGHLRWGRHPRSGREQAVVCLFNLSHRARDVSTGLPSGFERFADSRMVALVGGGEVGRVDGGGRIDLRLPPQGYVIAALK